MAYGRRRSYDDYDEDNPYYNDDDYLEPEDDRDLDDISDDDDEEYDAYEDDEDSLDDSNAIIKELKTAIKENDFDKVQELVENTDSFELDDVILAFALKNSSDFNIFCWLLDESSKSVVFNDESFDFDALLKKFGERCAKESIDSGYVLEVAERLLLHGGLYEGEPKRRIARMLDDDDKRRLREVEDVVNRIRDILDAADLDFTNDFAKKCVANQTLFEALKKKNDLTYDQVVKMLEKKSSKKL